MRRRRDPRGSGQAYPLKVETGYGRLYVTGRLKETARNVPGAAWNEGREAYEVSLTLPTLFRLKESLQWDSQMLAAHCTPSVMKWARAASASEDRVKDLHTRIGRGHRTDLPWHDARADTPAPEKQREIKPEDVYTDDSGRLRWRYREPYEHQRVMGTVASEVEGSSFLAEMGTGKTRAAIEAAAKHMRDGTVDLILVLCPAGVMGTWEREARTWTPDLQPKRLDEAVTERVRWLKAAAGMESDTMDPARGWLAILNYDVLYRMEDALLDVMGKIRVGLILDEGHRVRNPGAKTAKVAMEMARLARWRLHQTGTVILNGVQNVWSQWYIVDLGVTFGANFVQFRREFFEESPYTRTLEMLSTTTSEVGSRLKKRGLIYLKENCLDLPPKVYEEVEVAMTPEQKRAYRDMEEDLIVELARLDEDMAGSSDAAVATIQLTMMLRLAQITSGYLPMKDLDGNPTGIHRFDGNPKLKAAVELVDDVLAEGRQVIVWAWFRQNVASLIDALREHDPVVIAGGASRRDRDHAEERFDRGEARVLIGNPASAGVGLNLQAASTAIYYSQTFDLEHRAQSEDRCHRSGSEIHDSVTYLDLIVPGTIDVDILTRLTEKQSVADAVLSVRERMGAS